MRVLGGVVLGVPLVIALTPFLGLPVAILLVLLCLGKLVSSAS